MGGLSGAEAEDKIGVIDAWAGGGLIAAAATVSIVEFSAVAEWINFGVGQWAAIAPWLLGFAMHSAARWEQAAAGLSVAVLAAVQLCLAEHHGLAPRGVSHAADFPHTGFLAWLHRGGARAQEIHRPPAAATRGNVIPITRTRAGVKKQSCTIPSRPTDAA